MAFGMGRWLVGVVLAALGVAGFASTFVVAGEVTRHCGVTPMAMVVTLFLFACKVIAVWLASCHCDKVYCTLFSLRRVGECDTFIADYFLSCTRVFAVLQNCIGEGNSQLKEAAP